MSVVTARKLPQTLLRIILDYANPAGLLKHRMLKEMLRMSQAWETWLYEQELDWDNPGPLPDRNIAGQFLRMCVQKRIHLRGGT